MLNGTRLEHVTALAGGGGGLFLAGHAAKQLHAGQHGHIVRAPRAPRAARRRHLAPIQARLQVELPHVELQPGGPGAVSAPLSSRRRGIIKTRPGASDAPMCACFASLYCRGARTHLSPRKTRQPTTTTAHHAQGFAAGRGRREGGRHAGQKALQVRARRQRWRQQPPVLQWQANMGCHASTSGSQVRHSARGLS